MKPACHRIPGLVLWALVGFLFCAGAAAAAVKDKINKSFSVSPGGQLFVNTDIGSVEIKTGVQSAVEVEIALEVDTRDEEKARTILDRFDVDFEQDGDVIYITGDYSKKDRGWRSWDGDRNQLQVKFYVTVPREFDISIETSAGHIAVASLKGDVKVKTSGGSLTFDKIEGAVKGKTSGGSITLVSCVGTADVKTSGGSINIGQVSGDVVARTSGGSISVDEIMGAIDASTSGGSIEARITRQPRDDCRLVTSGGSITVYLDGTMNIDLNAVAGAGRITTDFPVKVSGRISKSSLTAEINEGGPELYLRTSGGRINIREI